MKLLKIIMKKLINQHKKFKVISEKRKKKKIVKNKIKIK